jgi:hypothetical protein
MSIKVKKFMALLILLIFIFSGCKEINKGEEAYKNKYVINVYYSPKDLSIFASQKLSYKNT